MKSIIAYLSMSVVMIMFVTKGSTALVNDLTAALDQSNDRYATVAYEE